MEIKNCSEMTNSEIKEYLLNINNEFEATKTEMKKLCDKIAELEHAYEAAQAEINLRRNIF